MQRDPRAFLWDVRESALANATVRALTVWNVTQSSLPALLVCVNELLEELGED